MLSPPLRRPLDKQLNNMLRLYNGERLCYFVPSFKKWVIAMKTISLWFCTALIITLWSTPGFAEGRSYKANVIRALNIEEALNQMSLISNSLDDQKYTIRLQKPLQKRVSAPSQYSRRYGGSFLGCSGTGYGGAF
jgi:hypothetical protein